MSASIRALKRKNKLKNKDTIITKANSVPNLLEKGQSQSNLKIYKSDSDVTKTGSVPVILMNSAKSERFLESIIQVNNNIQYFNQGTSSIPTNRDIFRSTSTPLTSPIDAECNRQEIQSKINIFGYEVMENRERFTVRVFKIFFVPYLQCP